MANLPSQALGMELFTSGISQWAPPCTTPKMCWVWPFLTTGKFPLAPETKPSNYGLFQAYVNILSRMRIDQSECLVSVSCPTTAIPSFFLVLGQSGQGMELCKLQAEAQLHQPRRLPEHCDHLSRWIFLCFWRQGWTGHVVRSEWRQAPLYTRW